MRVNFLRRFVVTVFTLTIISTNSVSAQTTPMESNFKSKLATVIFVGLGGAVLGLSTLSFYGEPEEHISNITTGFALGILAGTSYVVYDSATQSTSSLNWIDELKTIENKNNSLAQAKIKKPTLITWVWSF